MEKQKPLTNSKKEIDELIEEFKKMGNWNEIIPEFDDEALMVHWTNCGSPSIASIAKL